MTNTERRAKVEVAIDVANKVYLDMCRDMEVSKKQVQDFCDLIIRMQYFASSLDPRPCDHEEYPDTDA